MRKSVSLPNLSLLSKVLISFGQFKSTVDPFIFRSLAAYWENQFFKDMGRLRVRNPDTLTRVTEYVPEIVSFVEQIIKNGYGYELDGSVYFDTIAFDKADGHDYAKLEPWSKYNRENVEGQIFLLPGQSCSLICYFTKKLPYLRRAVVAHITISPSGRLPKQVSHLGLRRGVQVVQDGTSSALSWLAPYSGTIWTSILAVVTWLSRIMIMRWRSRRYVV